MRWVLVRTGKWHAWPYQGRSSLCSTLTLDNLRAIPARQINTTLPEGAVVCVPCGRRAGPGAIIPSPPLGNEEPLNPRDNAWLGLLRRHLIHAHARANEADLRSLARRLGTLGPTTDPQAQDAYDQLRVLLLTPHAHHRRRKGGKKDGVVMKITRLHETLKILPANPQALFHIAAATRAWRKITGRTIDRGERFQLDTIITSMLAVPTPEPYIRHLHTKGLSNLALMFHPNTLEKSRKDAAVRGVFSGTSDYMQHTADQLAAQTVKDE